MKYLLLLLGFMMLGACTRTPRRNKGGQLLPERETMYPDRFSPDSMRRLPTDSLR